jgi:hypothetical protein
MHPGCHRKHHTEHSERRSDERRSIPGQASPEAVLRKRSKRYDDKPFAYWWDIAPNSARNLENYEAVEFVKSDTGEGCLISIGELMPFLKADRQTSRGAGNWGIKILKKRPNELAFEPKFRQGEWLFHSVVWECHQDED